MRMRLRRDTRLTDRLQRLADGLDAERNKDPFAGPLTDTAYVAPPCEKCATIRKVMSWLIVVVVAGIAAGVGMGLGLLTVLCVVRAVAGPLGLGRLVL